MMKFTNKVALSMAVDALREIGNEYYTFVQGDEVLEVSTQEVIDKLTGMIAQLDKKASAERKPTKAQLEAEPIKEAILEVLACGESLTVAEIQERDERLALPAISSPRISALLRVMKDEGKVIREIEGRKARYHLA